MNSRGINTVVTPSFIFLHPHRNPKLSKQATMAASSKVMLKNPLSTSSKLLNRVLSSARPSSGVPRRLNTSAAAFIDSDDSSDDEDFRAFYGIDPRSGRHSPFFSYVISPSDVFAPMSGRSLREAMETKEAPSAAIRLTSRAANYSVRDKADGVHLRFEMPGLGKEDVKVTVERKTLVVSGGDEAAKGKESEGDEDGDEMMKKELLPVKVDLPAKSKKAYKLKEIKAEMKNGVLKVVVPKVKDEERGDVVNVAIA